MKQQHMEVMLEEFRQYMLEDGKSNNTIEKYTRDIRQFLGYAQETKHQISDQVFLQKYRNYIGEHYLVSSANSKISAANYYLKMAGLVSCRIRNYKVQTPGFRSEARELTRDEYLRLMQQAHGKQDRRLYMIMETITTTGIRISELKYVTVESLRKQEVVISIKGKTRIVLLPARLCAALEQYVQQRNIRNGPVFVTRSGKPVDRSNVLHDMKRLSGAANVSSGKVFPHNLRHLFAITYYETEKDVCHLADILGHSDINTTRIYTALSSSSYRKKIEELDLFPEA